MEIWHWNLPMATSQLLSLLFTNKELGVVHVFRYKYTFIHGSVYKLKRNDYQMGSLKICVFNR